VEYPALILPLTGLKAGAEGTSGMRDSAEETAMKATEDIPAPRRKEKKKFITSKCRAESILDKKTPLGNKQKRR
jgi:hypothetical protein